jgi:peptidyl-prolyl cis-trans isomerase SurA
MIDVNTPMAERPRVFSPSPRKRVAGARTAAVAVLALALSAPGLAQTAGSGRSTPRTADYIVAVVNQELVTNGELEQRLARVRDQAARTGAKLPPAAELRQQLLDALIDERVQVTYARDNGTRVDDAELDRAVVNVAQQNQITMAQLRQRLAAEGMDYGRFRNNIRDQMMIERVREREVQARIRVTESEIEAFLDKQRARAGAATEYNIAQILVTVPEGATVTEAAQRRARFDAALARVRAGESFEAVAREVSEDANKAQGGVIGLRQADRLPDVFVEQVRNLKPGEIAPTELRTSAGFHALKLIERREAGAFAVTQTRARHILLRTSPQLNQEAAIRRLAEFKRQIVSGGKGFEQMARENSQDGSAPQGGELGWASPGQFVPEFEEAMNALPINGISDPLVSRFGVHLIQVLERRQTTLDAKQQREQARNILREQKFDQAYVEWLRDLRARAYVEMREPPT